MRAILQSRSSRRALIASAPVVGLVAATSRAVPALARQATPAASFPVEIEHMFGVTEVPAAPERVVTIGFSEQDPVLALGVKPVAVREWFGGKPYAVWPWAEEALGDAEPVVLEMPYGELDYEQVLALDPDLIIATHSGITEEEYDRLAGIAPTVAQSGEYPVFGMPWEEQTRTIGRALGREARAEELIADVEAGIAAAAEAHPEFAGVSICWINPTGDGSYYLVGPDTPPMRFIGQLGFDMPEELREIVGDLDSAPISAEQLHLVDTDVLITQVGSEGEGGMLLEDSVFSQLRVVQEERAIIFAGADDPTYAALSFSTVLSLPYALERLTPMLEEAVGRL